jgi:serine protease Do
MKEIDYEEKETKKKRKSDGGNPLVSAFITFIVCFLAFVIYRNYYMTIDQQNTIDNTNNNEVSKLEKSVTITDNGIADAVEKVYDSVVVIETYINDKAYSTGTGFVFKTNDKYGYIMTNHHVIANSNKIKVTFTNNKTVEATLVGSDEYSDIAVLTVNKKDVISVCEIGSSSKMRVGDTTFAVGAPIDSSVYSWTVTRGILSGKNRLVEVSGSGRGNSFIMEVLQTDAAINSGNSGGPLCNANGEVIGVTNMKLASSQIEGMGFAIPIEDAVSYSESIISGKGIERPYLGVAVSDYSYTQNSSGGIFRFFNVTTGATGVYVQTVESGSCGDKAGIKVGDNIKKVAGVEVSDTSHFKYELYKHAIGETITITVEREGATKDLSVTLDSNLNKNK